MWRLVLGVAALFALLSLILPRAGGGGGALPPAPPPIMEGLSMHQYGADGGLLWSLEGGSLRRGDGIWHWREVRARMVAEGWRLSAERARHYEGGGLIELSGAVRGLGPGVRLDAEELGWRGRQLCSDGAVRIEGDFGSLSGLGLAANLESGRYEILERVRGVHHVRQPGGAAAAADSWRVQAGRLEHREGRSLYSGGVRWSAAVLSGDAESLAVEWDGGRARSLSAAGAPLRLRRDGDGEPIRLSAARMEYDPEGAILRMSGGVEVRRGELQLRGGSLEYELEGGRLRMHGAVRARRGDATMVGGSLEYDVASGLLEVEGAS